MRFYIQILLLMLCNTAVAVELGVWTEPKIDTLLQTARSISDPGLQVEYLSRQFLNTRYKSHTLIGSNKITEKFVVRLDALDCMTYIENIEAMRRSFNFADYLDNLKHVRYKNAEITFQQRNHFFSDWTVSNAPYVQDVTVLVGDGVATRVAKVLNQAGNKSLIQGIPIVTKTLHYIPAAEITPAILQRLRNGDYVGNYSDLMGLDVNHVGIVIKKDNRVYLRHANADEGVRRVTENDFLGFFKNQLGIVVFRPYSQ